MQQFARWTVFCQQFDDLSQIKKLLREYRRYLTVVLNTGGQSTGLGLGIQISNLATVTNCTREIAFWANYEIRTPATLLRTLR